MVLHFALGTLGFAAAYVILGPYLSGPGWLRGMTFMVAVWLLASLVAMPILGVGLFFGGPKEAMAALLGHVVLGAILGLITRLPDRLVYRQL